MRSISGLFFFFFFNDTATTEIYTLSLHDALPIYRSIFGRRIIEIAWQIRHCRLKEMRSEEHTSELQSLRHLVCRLLLEKKKKKLSSIHRRHVAESHLCTRERAPDLSRRNHAPAYA